MNGKNAQISLTETSFSHVLFSEFLQPFHINAGWMQCNLKKSPLRFQFGAISNVIHYNSLWNCAERNCTRSGFGITLQTGPHIQYVNRDRRCQFQYRSILVEERTSSVCSNLKLLQPTFFLSYSLYIFFNKYICVLFLSLCLLHCYLSLSLPLPSLPPFFMLLFCLVCLDG